ELGGEDGLAPEQLVRLADLYQIMGNPELAYSFTSKAITLDPGLDSAFLRQASVLVGQKKYDLALPVAREAYRLNTERIRKIIKKSTGNFLDEFYQFGRRVTVVDDIDTQRDEIFLVLADIYTVQKMYSELLVLGEEAEKMGGKSTTFAPMI